MRIALPVETIVRELKGKLWLALNLVTDGHEVVFGELSSMKQGLDVIEPDVFFRTSAVHSKSKLAQNRFLKNNGASIVVLDTEGGAFKGGSYFNQRLNNEMLQDVDRYFAWGPIAASVIKESTEFPAAKTVITGNPRFDILHPGLRDIYKKEGDVIRDDFGKFVLVNTNFGLVNHHNGASKIPSDTREGKLYHEFINLCHNLNEFLPELSIVVRPHPGENHETYEQEFHATDGVSVEHYGDVRSWIYAAEAMVHNNSTTGVEAALMERPVFAYKPIELREKLTHISNQINQEVETVQQMRDEIIGIKEQPGRAYPLGDSKLTELRRHIWNVYSPSTDIIVSEISELDAKWTGATNIPVPMGDRLKRLSVQNIGVERTEAIISQVSGREYTKLRQKFPRLNRNYLISEIDRFTPYLDISKVRVNQVNELGYVYELSN